jgi:hypothetical protein
VSHQRSAFISYTLCTYPKVLSYNIFSASVFSLQTVTARLVWNFHCGIMLTFIKFRFGVFELGILTLCSVHICSVNELPGHACFLLLYQAEEREFFSPSGAKLAPCHTHGLQLSLPLYSGITPKPLRCV